MEESAFKSWVPTKEEKMQEAVTSSMIYSLSKQSSNIAEHIVPWYLSTLPSEYFAEIGESCRMEHLKALAALKGISHAHDMTLSLRSRDEENKCTRLSVLRSDCRPGALHKMLSNMKPEAAGSLQSVRSYTAFDSSLTLNVFTYGDDDGLQGATLEDGKFHMDYASSDLERAAVSQYLILCHPLYAKHTSPKRFHRHRELYNAVKGSDRVKCCIDPTKDKDTHEIVVVTSTPRPESFLTTLTALLATRGINIVHLQMDVISDPQNPIGDTPGSVSLVRVMVRSAQSECPKAQPFLGDFTDLTSQVWSDVQSDLCRLKWLDNVTLDLGLKHCPELGLQRAEILTGLVAMLHGPLSKVNPLTYSRANLHATIQSPFYTHFFAEIADLFLARFNPIEPLQDDDFSARTSALRGRLKGLVNESARIAMLKMVDAVEFTVRTNLFVPSRYALAFRVDPALMVSAEDVKPFGVIFVHGQGFDGFHNRFQNIARGGLRLVSPNNIEQYAIESSRCYDEVYGLSYAQQLKNKDIPEGGSKAVCLVNLADVDPSQRHRILRYSVRGFTDAILDLIVTSDDTRQHMVDHLGFEELIYLGPDEQIIPEDINWIIQHAARRGYPIPAAFMSSKPLAGINHKEYGVTSEGVAVFLDVALRRSGINPKEQEFTVKITGGPDGDVAGNLMRILFREYGDNVKIVGVADGSGCAEDPAGLSHAELMRLFDAALPIGDLCPSTLSSNGFVSLADTEEGIRMRNTLPFRVPADVFVPAGGRPNTIHAGNWENFLDAHTGRPSSPLIVEGANIFITPEARTALFAKANVNIVKDSSANKCGVITSSYEICASMLLDESEFLEIKEELVQDVLSRLRELARLEAELMFREFENFPGALPEFSQRISRAINKAKAAVADELADMQRGDSTYQDLMPLFLQEHLPRRLADVAAHRVDERIPLDYIRNAFATCLATKLLYREGTHFLEAQPRERLARIAVQYYHKEQRVQHLLKSVSTGAIPDDEKQEVLQLLQIGGTRSALQLD